ncbi:MAG: hypothetical protein U0V73_04095 [Acidimicrobiia bacterium]
MDAVDDRRHEPGPEPGWRELVSVDFAAPDGRGGSLHIGVRPHEGTAWCWAYVVLPDGRPVAVRDESLAVPRPPGFAVRGDGLWAELFCETPWEHWSIGLEALGVVLDDPRDAFAGERGEPIAVGFDLEWEATTPPWPIEAGFLDDVDVGFEHAGVVHGEVLVGDDTWAFEGTGERVHRLGVEPERTDGWHRAALQLGEGLALAFECDATGVASGYMWRAGEEQRPVRHVLVESHRDGVLPTAARYVVDAALELDVEILGLAPVPRPDGGRLVRGVCRYEAAEGEGTGWSEWYSAR